MRAIKNQITLVLFILVATIGNAQDEHWEVYLASYEDGVGSTTLNMALYDNSPNATYPYLVIVAAPAPHCDDDGLPTAQGLDKLYATSERVNKIISAVSTVQHVGSFTHQCERSDYFYVRDTSNIRKALYDLRKKEKVDFVISIEDDKEWSAYRTFLYPNEEILEFISNEKVISQLEEAGDQLTTARPVDHWLHFPSDADRKNFIEFARAQNYSIETEYIDGEHQPFQLRLTRTDRVDIESIQKITLALRAEARKHSGTYDGWETIVVK